MMAPLLTWVHWGQSIRLQGGRPKMEGKDRGRPREMAKVANPLFRPGLTIATLRRKRRFPPGCPVAPEFLAMFRVPRRA
ncbi:hypothetical protein HPB47_021420 [Ixodes persulcatus]|uniref:Uncharacterized protein n=1 Tax=Ixodes persulcatus TaxID=34615 RepID=A0AC60QCI3_IXOPE|nr:hypothetical protein HPB47_021420 [Ixodes persulcatus]